MYPKRLVRFGLRFSLQLYFGLSLTALYHRSLREHAWERAATQPMVPLSVVGVWLESPHAQAAARACFAHDLMLVTVSIDGLCTWQAAAHNSSVAWSADYLAAWFGPRSDWLQFVS